MSQQPPPQPPVVAPSEVEAVLSFITDLQLRRVHYIGHIDERLAKAIVDARHFELSAMDYWDRYHRSAIGFCIDEGLDHSHLSTPQWLEGIPLYGEGLPPHDVLIQDIPWLEGQWTQYPSAHRRPQAIALLGDATQCSLVDGYEWRTWTPGLKLGLSGGRSWPVAPSSQPALF